MATDRNRIRGEITEILPNLEFRVRLEGKPEEQTTRCYMAGKMRMAKIRCVIGDRVEVVLGGDIGRIVRRM